MKGHRHYPSLYLHDRVRRKGDAAETGSVVIGWRSWLLEDPRTGVLIKWDRGGTWWLHRALVEKIEETVDAG